MPYEITVRRTFSAAHAIRLRDESLEPHHGHNWPVAVTLGAEALDEIETLMDFHELEGWLEEILAPADNHDLNTIEPFRHTKVNPTAERVAWWIGSLMMERLEDDPRVRLVSVEVGEAAGCTATWRPEREAP